MAGIALARCLRPSFARRRHGSDRCSCTSRRSPMMLHSQTHVSAVQTRAPPLSPQRALAILPPTIRPPRRRRGGGCGGRLSALSTRPAAETPGAICRTIGRRWCCRSASQSSCEYSSRSCDHAAASMSVRTGAAVCAYRRCDDPRRRARRAFHRYQRHASAESRGIIVWASRCLALPCFERSLQRCSPMMTRRAIVSETAFMRTSYCVRQIGRIVQDKDRDLV